MKVILDINGFTKMIDWPDDRIGSDIAAPFCEPLSIYELAHSRGRAGFKTWIFKPDHQLTEDIYLYKFQSESNR